MPPPPPAPGPLPRRWAAARIYVLPIALFLALSLPLFTRGDYEVDTALYAGLSMHMVREGTWWTPAAGDLLYFNKPPLVFWLHAPLLALFGPRFWAIMLPQALAAAGCVAFTVSLARTLAGRRVAMTAGVLLATLWPVFGEQDRLVLDFWLSLLLLGAARAAAPIALGSASRPLVNAAAIGACVGLGLMVKPLLALLALPILGAWWAAAGRARALPLLGPALLVAIALAAPWHASMYALHGDLFVREYLGREVGDRLGGERFSPQPWWYYGQLLFQYGHPWIGLAPFAALGALVALRARAGFRRRERQAVLFGLIWSGAWLAAASLFPAKDIRYVLHVWPAVVLLVAMWFVRWRPFNLRPRPLPRAEPLIGSLLALSVALTALDAVPTGRAEPEWEPLYAYVRERRAAGEEVWNLTLWFPLAGRVYLHTGVWPRQTRDWNDRPFREPPPGALGLTRPEHAAFAPLRAGDAVVWEEGRLRVVRLGRARSDPSPAQASQP